MLSGVRSLVYLQVRIGKNWLRRSYRSAIVWIIAIGGLAGIGSSIFLGDGAAPQPEVDSSPVDNIYLQAMVVAMFVGMALLSIWRGARTPPRASLADVVFVLGSPLTSRLQYAYLMLREAGSSFVFAFVIVAVSLVLSLTRLATTGEFDARTIVDAPVVTFFVILTISELLRFAVWILTEQVVARDVAAGFRVRRIVRFGTFGVAAGLLVLLVAPVIAAEHTTTGAAVEDIAERIMAIGHVPPMVWVAAPFIEGESIGLALAGLLLLCAAVTAVALVAARDFTESLAIAAERQTDARGQMTDIGADVHWAAMSQLGASSRLRFSLPAFGHGPWAILWASITRWTRYQLAVAWISVITTIVIGGSVAVLVRLETISHYWAWGVVLSMPLFNAFSLLLDELRKPFIYLTPGPAWQRLIAAGTTSVLDGFLASLSMVAILAITRARPLLETLALLGIATAIAFATQAAVGLVQVILPAWLNRRIRTMLTFTGSICAVLPAAIAFLTGYLVSGIGVAFLASVAAALVCGVILLAFSALLFNRLEMPG